MSRGFLFHSITESKQASRIQRRLLISYFYFISFISFFISFFPIPYTRPPLIMWLSLFKSNSPKMLSLGTKWSHQELCTIVNTRKGKTGLFSFFAFFFFPSSSQVCKSWSKMSFKRNFWGWGNCFFLVCMFTSVILLHFHINLHFKNSGPNIAHNMYFNVYFLSKSAYK